MSEWNVAQPLDYSATGDDIDSASQKIIATFVDVYDKLNRLRSLDASAEHTVGDAAAYSIKIDTSVTPAAILMRNAANTGYIQIGSVAENMGITAADVGAIQGDGMGKISLGAEANLPSAATTYDLYFAYDTGRLYMYRTGAWRVFLSLRFEDLLGISDAVVERDEVAANGANKIPRLNSVGQGEFDITGSAAKIGGKDLYLPELHDNQVLVYNGARDRWEVAPRDELTNDDVSTTGEPDKIVKTDSNGNAHVNITGNAAKIATKTIDVSNLQDGDVLVYDATRGVFYNKQGATVNAQGVVEANVSGSAQKWAGKALQTVGMTDGQILVWSEANQAFINRNQSAVGNARALSLSQDGEQLANYNGDDYRAVNIITPHLRVASHAYTVGQTCFSKNMPSTMYLECVTAGVTQAVEPDFSSATIGSTVTDGGAEWKVCGYVNTEVTDALEADLATKGVPVGYVTPFLQSTAPDGWLSCTGAEVSRTAYPDLWAFVNGSSQLISETDWQSKSADGDINIGWFSSGDGSTTFRLPRIVGSGELTKVKRFTTAGAGTFTAPVTGIYKITLQGAGGGGGGAGGGSLSTPSGSATQCAISGNGGGAGGYIEFYEKLTAGTSYNYTIGAGGAGGAAGTVGTPGTPGTTGTGGTNGGNSIITINNNTYKCTGGDAGNQGSGVAGVSGNAYVNDEIVGSSFAGNAGTSSANANLKGGSGGGAGGAISDSASAKAVFGGGGAGGMIKTDNNCTPGGAGGDGYIEFAYNPVPQYWYVRAFGSATNQGTIDITELANMLNAKLSIADVPKVAGFSGKQTFTSSGTFTPTITGNYKITLQGGGGGGGGIGQASTGDIISGGGGGQGGRLEFYEKLIAGTSYSFTIGAGGTGGAHGVPGRGDNGLQGGASSFTVNGNVYTCNGGKGGKNASGDGQGGDGGTSTINDTTYYNALCGGAGVYKSSNYITGGNGGGFGGIAGGYFTYSGRSGSGGTGGGCDSSTYHAGGAGGDGYITFEWQTASLV